jgi:medium-chain acyl-[acyl-carrier-protein] hydrolase
LPCSCLDATRHTSPREGRHSRSCRTRTCWIAYAASGGTPLETLADPDLMELYLPVVRADLAAAETYEYRPGRPLTCPITAFLGNVDSETDRTSVCGWADLTVAPFRMHELSGDHFFINTRATQIISAIASQLITTAAAPSAD